MRGEAANQSSLPSNKTRTHAQNQGHRSNGSSRRGAETTEKHTHILKQYIWITSYITSVPVPCCCHWKSTWSVQNHKATVLLTGCFTVLHQKRCTLIQVLRLPNAHTRYKSVRVPKSAKTLCQVHLKRPLPEWVYPLLWCKTVGFLQMEIKMDRSLKSIWPVQLRKGEVYRLSPIFWEMARVSSIN